MKQKNKWIFIKKDCYLWSNPREFAFCILPSFSISWYHRHIHFEFEWIFWGIIISIRMYKLKKE